MPTQEEVTNLCNSFGWESIHSKNPYMISFTREGVRMNIYYTTMTVSLQSPVMNSVYHKNVKKLEDLEDIIQ